MALRGGKGKPTRPLLTPRSKCRNGSEWKGLGELRIGQANAAAEAYRTASTSGGGFAKQRRKEKVISSQGNTVFDGVAV